MEGGRFGTAAQSMTVRYFTFEQYHNKSNVGSTRLQVHQVINHWPEAGLYKYGEQPDAMIFQKVYMQPDWKFMEHFKGIKLLYMCDPDWLDGVEVKRTIDAVDGVVCPTETMAEFLSQLTDKPIKVIPDRHELGQFPRQAKHEGPIKSVVWFGYKHNAVALKWAMNFLVRNNIKLTVISNEDPRAWEWAEDDQAAKGLYSFELFDHEVLNERLARHDAALLPVASRPVDRFKSNNRTVIAWLSGLPVITDAETYELFSDSVARKAEANKNLAIARRDFDVKLTVEELKSFIEGLG